MAKKKTTQKKTQKATKKKTVTSKKSKPTAKATLKKRTPKIKTTKKKDVVVATTATQGDPMFGTQVPLFTCLDSQGRSFELANQKGRKTVLYFYPKDDTPGCTIEGKEFSDLHAAFQKKNTNVFGVSRDSVKSHDKFKCKYGFQFELLSDEDEKICKIFDVIKEKNMYGKMVMGIERSTFILDEDLKVIYVERKVKAEGHAQRILDQIK